MSAGAKADGAKGSRPIDSYGLIGDLETAALVGRDGSIDWLCWPRFDSDSTFAALLGDARNGRWAIAPVEDAQAERRYRGNTLILETRFTTDEGSVELIDFMPPRRSNSDVVRIVQGRSGRVKMRMELVIRFSLGTVVPWVRRLDEGSQKTTLLAVAGPDMVVLRSSIDVHGEDAHTIAEFEVGEGDEVQFILTYGPSYRPVPGAIDVHRALDETEQFWTEWCSQRNADGRELNGEFSTALTRSLITLKALTYAPTGGIVAAPTASLPERLGGSRNWDYRFCWLRDATITLLALIDAGYSDESQAWRNWLLRAVAGSPDQVQIMYGVAGERRLSEWTADWLEGYAGSQPVRIGNAAHQQLQLDVFGEVMDALHQARLAGIPESRPAWAMQRALVEQLESVWREPDHGMWEVRSGRRHFTYSKIMAWVAVDRCIKSVERFGLDGPIDHWRKLRGEIHADVCAHGFDPELDSFTQSYGSKTLDASLLLIPTLGFLPASDKRYVSTVARIEAQLLRNGFVLRYDPDSSDDGVGGDEGAFLACSFWLADAYAMLGRRREAEKLVNRLLSFRNDLGLMSEEYDPHAKRMLGNFPQAFSHVAMINSILRLSQSAKPDERKPAKEAGAEEPERNEQGPARFT